MKGNIFTISSLDNYQKIEGKTRAKKTLAWYDADEVILHASFQALVDFIEKENPSENRKYDPEKEAIEHQRWNEIRMLYKWWTKERIKEWGLVVNGVASESDFDDKCTRMLLRLVQIRQWLWT